MIETTANVRGKRTSEAPETVREAGRKARAAVEKDTPLSEANYRELYKKAQAEFSKHVRDDDAAAGWLREHGFDFETTGSGAPAVEQARKRRK